ncbi:MarR family transcriptional regulator [Nakamurella flavida]|uniref:MarR family transcriptional regulator n=1 Tax=Nakamurella flavida TaxID=363630 RepID=A0A939C1K8_9ACTN|nr:MarR family transcriptional regulator [Nakamurella flavida]MBM9475560.1 MarR family transcriptional regulator [Nakamurella flavida]MDP9778165.1 DNA-binding MarR family transcriptional regulator [Nakamurella flavida]
MAPTAPTPPPADDRPDPVRGPRPPLGPGPDSELTWLLHRAAQRMHTAVGAQAARHGLTLRDHIVLSALDKTSGLTQIELGQALGVDKTTLVAELDRLEKAGLVERKADPRDRRARIPALTDAGDRVRARIAVDATAAETAAVASVDPALLRPLRDALYAIIAATDDPGSCI